MTSPRVLISDALSSAAVAIFKDRGVTVEFAPSLGKDKEKLAATIDGFDGLAIRSTTKVTAKLLETARNLKVIGRAGIGVDNVDVPAATARGIIVMNTPFGNSITTAEHAISLMLALARQIPEADASTRAGKWEKNKFLGVEIFGKTLGVIGCGNIGAIVADRALGMKMKVVAYDPYLSAERAVDLGVEKLSLEELLQRADFVTLHTPLTEKTRNIISADSLALTKKGVRLINCARGGLIDEAALFDALKSGQVAGAALDVFASEPATDSPLFALPNVVCTPHLGASTSEAQENVALQVAEQMSDYLIRGAITNAVNFPSISAEEGTPGDKTSTRFSTWPSSPTSTTSARSGSRRTNSICFRRELDLPVSTTEAARVRPESRVSASPSAASTDCALPTEASWVWIDCRSASVRSPTCIRASTKNRRPISVGSRPAEVCGA